MFLPRLLAATVAALLLLEAAAFGGDPRVTRDMYGDRYCEYLVVTGAPPDLTADVWNTYGLNSCPDARWRRSDAARLAQETNALAVVLNGPRYWLMDRGEITLERGLGQVRLFSSGLRLRRIAQVKVPPNRAPYQETTVLRDNTFTWSRSHPVYELVAPNGRVYVMQTYARIVDPSLTIPRLARLGRRLKLPDGWRYRTRRLRRDLSVDSRGRAVVIQDDFQNTYQLRR